MLVGCWSGNFIWWKSILFVIDGNINKTGKLLKTEHIQFWMDKWFGGESRSAIAIKMNVSNRAISFLLPHARWEAVLFVWESSAFVAQEVSWWSSLNLECRKHELCCHQMRDSEQISSDRINQNAHQSPKREKSGEKWQWNYDQANNNFVNYLCRGGEHAPDFNRSHIREQRRRKNQKPKCAAFNNNGERACGFSWKDVFFLLLELNFGSVRSWLF